MKKVNFKSVLMAAVVVLAFFFVGTGTASAQSADLVSANSYQQLFSPPTGVFKSKVQAEAALNGKILQLKNLGANASPQVFSVIQKHYVFYRAILDDVEVNVAIPQAIANGVSAVSSQDVYGLSHAELTSLRNEAIDLLKN